MLNNINSLWLSESKKFEVLYYPGATSSNMVDKIDDVLDDKPELLIVQIGTNDLVSDVNILSNLNVTKTKKKSPGTALSFKISLKIIRKDKKNWKHYAPTRTTDLKIIVFKKNLTLINRGNLKENLGLKI